MNATLATEGVQSPPMPAQVTEDDMLRHLWRFFISTGWAAAPQVTIAPEDLAPSGYVVADFLGAEAPSTGRDRRIDLLAISRSRNPDKHGPLRTLAVEVKVTRADFLSDIRNPEKQAAWRAATTQHAYAVPAGLVQASEIPNGSGLIWVTPPSYAGGQATIDWVQRAPIAPKPRLLPLRAQIALLYRLSTFEGNTRGWLHSPAAAGTEQEVRGALAAAHKAAERLTREAATATGQRDAWRAAFALAAPAGVPCGICGRGIKPLRPGPGGGFHSWRHLERTDDEPCELAEQAQAADDARAAYDAATPADRDFRARLANRRNFNDAVEREPWRAFLRPVPDPPHPAYADPEPLPV